MSRRKAPEAQAEPVLVNDDNAPIPPAPETIAEPPADPPAPETIAEPPADPLPTVQAQCAECGGKLYVHNLGTRCVCNNQQCGQYMTQIVLGGGSGDE